MVKCHIGNKRSPMSKEGVLSPPFSFLEERKGLIERHNSIRERTGSTVPFCNHYSCHR